MSATINGQFTFARQCRTASLYGMDTGDTVVIGKVRHANQNMRESSYNESP